MGAAQVTVRSIRRTEIRRFAELSENPTRTEEVMVEMFDDCRSCPEWCFIAEQDDKVIARVGFWVLPSIISTFHVGWLQLPWRGDYLETGEEFWSRVLELVRGYGATSVESAIDSDVSHVSRRRRFYRAVGFPLIQQKWEYIWRRGNPLPRAGRRLVYRDLNSVGTDAFIEAIERVTEGTLDREDRLARKEDTPAGAARSYFGILKDIDYTPNRWFLAFDKKGALVGLIAPQMLNDTVGAVNYIGVVPRERGNGYVNDLIVRGTAILNDCGAQQVIASIDFKNTPMIAAAVRAGFKRDVSTSIFRLVL
jgi:RimJ/RimL family protein N-acetyltransferase